MDYREGHNDNQEESLFRQEAMEDMASPEQLDRLANVLTPKYWLVLVTICALAVLFVLCCFFGTIPQRASGSAILIKPAGIVSITPNAAGTRTIIDVLDSQVLLRQVEEATATDKYAYILAILDLKSAAGILG